jgi:hypothetical protein
MDDLPDGGFFEPQKLPLHQQQALIAHLNPEAKAGHVGGGCCKNPAA